MATFVDEVVLHVAAGNGGHGCASIHREKFKPSAARTAATAAAVATSSWSSTPTSRPCSTTTTPLTAARQRSPGQGNNRTAQTATTWCFLCQRHGGAHAGRPGPRGSRRRRDRPRHRRGRPRRARQRRASSTRRKAPGFALLGEPGWAGDIVLELKTVADVALVGYPSAGKSSLVAALSAPAPRSPTTPSRRCRPTSAWSMPAMSASPSPTFPA